MKKVLLLSVCLIVSCLLGGGKSWAAGNVNFSVADGTLTVSVSDQTTSEDETSFESFFNSASFTKIVFNGGGKVSNNFISKLNNRVSNVTSVDMGGVVVEDLTSSSIPSGFNFANITEFVVPQTKTENGEMIFPANVFKGAVWGINNNTKIVFPEGYTAIADRAFCNEYGGGYTGITSISFPTTLKTIGKYAFAGKKYLTSLILPDGLDKVDDGAFYGAEALKSIILNPNLRFIGAGAFGLSGSQDTFTTLKIPASVRYIGPYAFSERKYQDIYFLGNITPICPYGVFKNAEGTENYGTAFTGNDDKVHYCNGGFNATGEGPLADIVTTGYANRENYVNDNFYMTVIHYPSTAEDANRYTDQTRKYITKYSYDNDGNRVLDNTAIQVGKETTQLSYGYACNYTGNTVYSGYADSYRGDQYVWPSQSQFIRAYVTAALGLNWDGVTKYEPELSEWAVNILKEAGYNTDDADMKKNAYIGTRKFVLANNDAQSEKYNPGNIKKDGTWWTICVPFNMTKKQVLDTFGDKTQLCLFRSVTRQIEVNGKNHILIRFDIDPMKYKTADANGKKLKYDANETDGDNYTHAAGEWKYDEIANDNNMTVDDDDIAIWAHESYMIKPDDGQNSDKDPVTIVNYEPVPGNPLPSVVRAETVRLEQDDPDTKDLYRFVGNYESGMTMPQYSYYYGSTKSDPTDKFRFYTGTKASWTANKSLIQASAHDGGFQDFQNFFGGSAESAAKVKQTTVFGGIDDPNGDTTAIDDVQIVVGNDTLTPIFSLDGKMVSVNGDTTGLAKGIYVKAGKKFIVE